MLPLTAENTRFIAVLQARALSVNLSKTPITSRLQGNILLPPCVAIAVFDNAEDFSDNSDESFSEAMLDIEVCLQKWAEQYSALYKKSATTVI